MDLDIDYLISFFKKNTISSGKEEFVEQDTGSSSAGGSTGGSGKSPRKWSSNRKLGKTYMNDPKYVWKSDLTRGPANQLFYDV